LAGQRDLSATKPGAAKQIDPEPSRGLLVHDDGITRCLWATRDPLYVAYHDEEWGVPEFDDRALFEKLLLDGFQAGLSWITILRKRPAFRVAFDGFDPERIARYDQCKLDSLMTNEGIVRNRAKIEGARASARAFLSLAEKEGLSRRLWNYVDGRPIQSAFASRDRIPAETPLSKTISRDLKSLGFAFCGPTIVYAFMQAVGMVNDHVVDCHRHEACRLLSVVS
jgi:DNA-3-methyladenine glycosylase I